VSRTQRRKRIRGRRAVAIRRRRLANAPLCKACSDAGRVRAARVIDHIVPLCKGGSDTDDNTQPLCAECHDDKTRVDMGYKLRARYDASGRVIWPTGGGTE
jgi:5-methylcytosine-specific restriction protein A